MLSPIPRRILRDTMTLYVPQGADRYQSEETQAITVHNVHIQNDNVTRKAVDNTEVTLRGVIFVDARYSVPKLDYDALQAAAQAAGATLTCDVTSRRGTKSGRFTILTVNGLPDDEANLHHYELEVV